MPAELPDDIFDVVLINEDVIFHDRFIGRTILHVDKDLLLVIEADLGVRDKGRKKDRMGSTTLFTPYTLDHKGDQI